MAEVVDVGHAFHIRVWPRLGHFGGHPNVRWGLGSNQRQGIDGPLNPHLVDKTPLAKIEMKDQMPRGAYVAREDKPYNGYGWYRTRVSLPDSWAGKDIVLRAGTVLDEIELFVNGRAVFEAPDEYVARCFAEYGLKTDASGHYAAMYKPYHLIGLELGISVASAGLRGEPTGAPTGWRGDVLATAKRDLKAGEILDGEGGYTVWGKLTTAAHSLALGGLPIGLADGCRLKNPVPAGEIVRRNDVDLDESADLVRVRREMEQAFAEAPRAAVAQ